jgi:hypothetical protein
MKRKHGILNAVSLLCAVQGIVLAGVSFPVSASTQVVSNVASETIPFYIRISESKITINADPATTTVGDLKEKIYHKTGDLVVLQTLTFAGKQLENANLLSQYGIKKWSTLVLSLISVPPPAVSTVDTDNAGEIQIYPDYPSNITENTSCAFYNTSALINAGIIPNTTQLSYSYTQQYTVTNTFDPSKLPDPVFMYVIIASGYTSSPSCADYLSAGMAPAALIYDSTSIPISFVIYNTLATTSGSISSANIYSYVPAQSSQ